MTSIAASLPPTFAATRTGLRSLACYVLGPYARTITGHIWLVPDAGGIATPESAHGDRMTVRGDVLSRGRASVTITDLRAAAELAGVDLTEDPGVGTDLPALEPDAPLAIDAGAAAIIGDWYELGASVLAAVRTDLGRRGQVSESKLWPEHFDLALTIEPPAGSAAAAAANVGCSPGDAFSDDPYLYVGPWDTSSLVAEIWNAPFGAVLTRSALAAHADPPRAARDFVGRALTALGWDARELCDTDGLS